MQPRAPAQAVLTAGYRERLRAPRHACAACAPAENAAVHLDPPREGRTRHRGMRAASVEDEHAVVIAEPVAANRGQRAPLPADTSPRLVARRNCKSRDALLFILRAPRP